mgnify:CR=1 FL=1
METERLRKVVVDTYALLAIVYDEVGDNARNVLEGIRRGEIEGLIPTTVVYEYVVHWLRGRIPRLRNLDELITYLRSYFKTVELSLDDYIEAAKIKIEGDKILMEAKDETLKSRRLSIVDSSVIAVACKAKTPIVSGDKDLMYVARKMGIETIW